MRKLILLICLLFCSSIGFSQNRPLRANGGLTVGDPSGTSADPTSLQNSVGKASIYFNETLDRLRWWNGYIWSDLGTDNLGNHIATQNISLSSFRLEDGTGPNYLDLDQADRAYLHGKSGVYFSSPMDFYFDNNAGSVLTLKINSGSLTLDSPSTSGTIQTEEIDVTNFNNNLSAADTTIQLALETLDDMVGGGGGGGPPFYETVTSIPSYLLPDDSISGVDPATVVDLGGGNYDILQVDGDEVPISLFGAKPDLEYLTVTTDGTTATITSATFTQEDVGKKIAIKNIHQNPATIDGSEFPDTQLGRIVTIRATILSVATGVSATIDFTPNIADTVEAYMYTNNTEAFYRAINYCYYTGKTTLVVDGNGIYATDIYDKGIYAAIPDKGFRILSSIGSLNIVGNGGAKMKNAAEDDTRGANYFDIDAGNGDFKITVPILPADRSHQDIYGTEHNILSVLGAGNSVRTITAENQKWLPEDLNGNDGFWTDLVNSDSTGGEIVNGLRKSQVFIFNNCAVRTKNGGITIFQNAGFSNEAYLTDVYLNDIQHFTGERGREIETDNTVNVMRWEYPTGNFSVTSNVVTTTEPDFSWYDYGSGSTPWTIYINGEQATLGTIIDAKTANLGSGISDTSNQDCVIRLTGRDYYNHAMYVHPSIILHMTRVKSNDGPGNVKMYSSGGGPDSSIGEWKVWDSELYEMETHDGSNAATETRTYIYNSKVDFYSMSGYCYVANSDVSGVFAGIEFKSLGGNTYTALSGSVTASNLNHIYDGEFGSIDLVYSGTNNHVTVSNHKILDNDRIPAVQDGILTIRDMETGAGRMLGSWLAGDITSNTTLRFINFNMNHFDGNFSFLRNNKWNFGGLHWENSSYIENYKDGNTIHVDRTNAAIGKMNVTIKNRPFYAQRIRVQQNNWYSYNEFEYVKFNYLQSNTWIVEDFDLSSIVGTFNNVQYTTNPNIQTFSNEDNREYNRNNLAFGSGFVNFIFKGNTSTNPYQHLNGAGLNNSSLRENTTLSNIVVKSIDRVDGEVVKFRIDSYDNRLVEVSSSVPYKYTSGTPTRLGVEGERLYVDDLSGDYYEYTMDFTDDSTNSYAGTQADVVDLDDTGTPIQTNTHLTITGTPEWSILQEKSDGTTLVPFDFTLNIDGGGTLEFEYNEVFVDKTYNTDFSTWWWNFKSSDAAGYECFVQNRTGEIVFNGTITETLDAANMITVNSGYRITNRQWNLVSGGGGSGNVTKVGTPAADEVGVWTGDGTLGRDVGLTYDSTFKALTLGEAFATEGQMILQAGTTGGKGGTIQQYNSDADDSVVNIYRQRANGDWELDDYSNVYIRVDDVTGAVSAPSMSNADITLGEHLITLDYFNTNGGGGGATQLDELSDVNTSTPTNRNFLVGDGTDWESRAMEADDIPAAVSGTGSTIPLSMVGTYHNTSSPLTTDPLTVTVTGSTNAGAWGVIRINTPTTEPTVTSGTQEGGIEWTANTTLDLYIKRDDTGIKYWYVTTSVASIPVINDQTGTTYTLTIDDANGIVTLDNAGAVTLTIPDNASVAFQIGTKIELFNKGSGTVTVGITTDTLNQNVGGLTLAQYDKRTITKLTATSWILSY